MFTKKEPTSKGRTWVYKECGLVLKCTILTAKDAHIELETRSLIAIQLYVIYGKTV